MFWSDLLSFCGVTVYFDKFFVNICQNELINGFVISSERPRTSANISANVLARPRTSTHVLEHRAPPRERPRTPANIREHFFQIYQFEGKTVVFVTSVLASHPFV